MKTIRQSIFETNSSSTHSIAISKKDVAVKDLPTKITFYIGEFGWSHEEVNRANYLYTALASSYNKEDLDDAIKHIKGVLLDIGIESEFETPKWNDEYDWLQEGYIDHNETGEFINAVMNNDQMLLRYLFSDSHVYTGNDNDEFDNDNETKYVAKSKLFDYNSKLDKYEYMDNPYHDETKYDYFYKGN